ncbi:hypothetical protein RB199_01065 [Streptomyces libani]
MPPTVVWSGPRSRACRWIHCVTWRACWSVFRPSSWATAAWNSCGASPERFLNCLDQLDRDDFLSVVSQLALYVNCLGGWNLHLYPWDAGDHLRQLRPHETVRQS